MGKLVIQADSVREPNGSLRFKMSIDSTDLSPSEILAVLRECVKSIKETETNIESAMEEAKKMGLSPETAQIILSKLNKILKDGGDTYE